MDIGFFKNKRVLLTGHTGFKGAWLSQILSMFGAEVTGISLEPSTVPSLFHQLDIKNQIYEHHIQDIRDYEGVHGLVRKTKPDLIFHLAAQPLVRYSYTNTLETYQTNVLGTANLLESLKDNDFKCTVVVVTTDKCYQNNEWVYGYRENDPLGGKDPYSASKACSEIVTSSYRDSFFAIDSNISLATARAGNVIGGGDWSDDRIVPDCMKGLSSGKRIIVRNPNSIRPWQHVLEPLAGYLLLSEKLYNQKVSIYSGDSKLDSAFNFGPLSSSALTVNELVKRIVAIWPGDFDPANAKEFSEAKFLKLESEKARTLLHWEPKWDIDKTIKNTVLWYKQVNDGSISAREITKQQICNYFSL